MNIVLLNIFSAYIPNYLYFFFSNKHLFLDTESKQEYLIVTYFPSNYNTIGKIYSVLFFYCSFMSIICLYITCLSDPGYLDSPMKCEAMNLLKSEKENNILKVNEHLMKDRVNFINNFSHFASNGPLNGNEYHYIKKTINTLFKLKVTHNNFDNNTNIPEGISLCSQCIRWKPERSHHCKRCNKCVKKMDHHCPWVSNCIGENNLKPFSLTLIYGVIPSGSIAFTYWEYLIIILKDYSTSNMLLIWNTFMYVCNLFLFLFLSSLLFTNIRLIASNMTTIEREEIIRYEMITRYINRPSIKNIYNKGIFLNLSEVFGSNLLLWFIPVIPKPINEYKGISHI